MNITLLERARCGLFSACMPRKFWAKLINTTCYLVNKSPSTAIKCRTPKEVWSGCLADYSGLRILCPTYSHGIEGKLSLELRSVFSLGMD